MGQHDLMGLPGKKKQHKLFDALREAAAARIVPKEGDVLPQIFLGIQRSTSNDDNIIQI